MSETTSTPTSHPVYRLHATLRGRVQGVGMRYWVHHTATQYQSIAGYVRNMPDGAVEVEAEGADKGLLESFLVELHRGPTTAHIENVATQWEENVTSRHSGFHVT
jgi:acylphosphatase